MWKKAQLNNSGQTFIEFLFLLLMMIVLSFTMLKGFNSNISRRWRAAVKVIAEPSQTPIQIN